MWTKRLDRRQSRDENETGYELIKAYRNKTGEGTILNTSFNLVGKPLVETPLDAIKSFALVRNNSNLSKRWDVSQYTSPSRNED